MTIIDNAMLWRQFAELQLYTMRHVQEHAAQLHLFLGQQVQQ
jgi:hypothetical protein